MVVNDLDANGLFPNFLALSSSTKYYHPSEIIIFFTLGFQNCGEQALAKFLEGFRVLISESGCCLEFGDLEGQTFPSRPWVKEINYYRARAK